MEPADPSAASTQKVDATGSAEVETLRALMTTATQRLLGDTIAVGEEQWRGPSRLPGWSRGHVATHLARQADALTRVIAGALAGKPQPMYGSGQSREDEIEAGAHRTGLALQIDLDTASGALSDTFDTVEHDGAWETVAELRGGMRAPLRLLPLARLSEVVLHHVDLDIGFEVHDIDQQSADWLLEWVALRVGQRDDFPAVRVRSDSGAAVLVGGRGNPAEVTGESAQLLGWLTGRADGTSVRGAEHITLPAF